MWLGSISPATRRRVHFAFRTAYSVSLTVLLMRVWQWAGDGTYVSLAVTILLTTMYLGQWQMNTWKVLYASFCGTVLGIVCIQVWAMRALYTVLFFLFVLALNKCAVWDQFTKIFAGLSFVIAAFMAPGQPGAAEAFLVNMLMFNIPSLVVGASLLLPPALAADSCARKVQAAQKLLGEIGTMYAFAICHPDFANFYLFEAETATATATSLLDAVAAVVPAVEAEQMLFPALAGMAESVRAFHTAARQVLAEFESMRSVHSRVQFNSTHAHIMSVLEPGLKDALASAAAALELAADCIAAYPAGLSHKRFLHSGYWRGLARAPRALLSRLARACACRLCHGYRANSTGDEEDGSGAARRPVSRYLSLLMSLSAGEGRSGHPPGGGGGGGRSRKDSLASNRTSRGEEDVAPLSRLEALGALLEECARLRGLRAALGRDIRTARERYLFRTDKSPFQDKPTGAGEVGASGTLPPLIGLAPPAGLNHPDVAERLRAEYLTLGVRNLVHRGAFLMHVMFVINEALELQSKLATASYSAGITDDTAQREALDCRFAALGSARRGLLYAASCARAALSVASYPFVPHVDGSGERMPLKTYIGSLFVGYMQPFKIAVAGTLCALLLIVPSWRAANPYGAWAAVVVMIVRQDSSSSSYLRGYQRLEGTVIGAVFSFALIRIFSGIHDRARAYNAVLQVCLVLWVGVCAYYREVPGHGYSAAVAALTPVILVIGNADSPNLESIAWSRVAMTFYGVMVYLVVDNAIYPTRSDALVRSGTQSMIADIRATVAGCKHALKELFSLVAISGGARNRAASVESNISLVASDQLEASVLSGHGSSDDGEFPGEKIRLNRAYSVGSSAVEMESVEGEGGEAPTGPHPSVSLLQVYARCRHTVQDEVFVRLTALEAKLSARRSQIALAASEPKLWHRRFPQAAYQRLQAATERAGHSLEAVASAILYLCTTLAAMPVRGSRHATGSVAVENLTLVGSMTEILLDVSDVADVALSNVVENITR